MKETFKVFSFCPTLPGAGREFESVCPIYLKNIVRSFKKIIKL